jgi:hypothetical protein
MTGGRARHMPVALSRVPGGFGSDRARDREPGWPIMQVARDSRSRYSRPGPPALDGIQQSPWVALVLVAHALGEPG